MGMPIFPQKLDVGTDDRQQSCLRRQIVTFEEILTLADELRRAHKTPAGDQEHNTQPDAPERE